MDASDVLDKSGCQIDIITANHRQSSIYLKHAHPYRPKQPSYKDSDEMSQEKADNDLPLQTVFI